MYSKRLRFVNDYGINLICADRFQNISCFCVRKKDENRRGRERNRKITIYMKKWAHTRAANENICSVVWRIIVLRHMALFLHDFQYCLRIFFFSDFVIVAVAVSAFAVAAAVAVTRNTHHQCWCCSFCFCHYHILIEF